MALKLKKGQPIEAVRYLYQLAGMNAFEVRPVDYDLRCVLVDKFIISARKGAPAVDENWCAHRIITTRDGSAANKHGMTQRDYLIIQAGNKRQCFDAAFNTIMTELADHVGRCIVCDRLPSPRRKIKEIEYGWIHQACSKEAFRGTRWLKGLKAPDRPLPANQRSLLDMPEAAGAGGC